MNDLRADPFYTWREPAEFLQGRAAISREIKDRDHRTQANKWFREAYPLGLIAVGTKATAVRLIKNDPPDGEIKLNGMIVPIEVVEALERGRQPDKEYKTGQVKHPSNSSEWDNDLSLLPGALDCAILKKETGNYSKETILLVYLNIGANVRATEGRLHQLIRSKCDADSSKFNAICILWRNWLFGPERIVARGRTCIDWRLLED